MHHIDGLRGSVGMFRVPLGEHHRQGRFATMTSNPLYEFPIPLPSNSPNSYSHSSVFPITICVVLIVATIAIRIICVSSTTSTIPTSYHLDVCLVSSTNYS